MPDCQLISGCLFFNGEMPDDRGLGAIYKRKYCRGESSACARYIVATAAGRHNVPANLYPNMLHRVDEILKQSC